jgi:hypothetical protein
MSCQSRIRVHYVKVAATLPCDQRARKCQRIRGMDHTCVRPAPQRRLTVDCELIHWDCLARRSAARRRQALAAGMRSSPARGLRRQETDRPAGVYRFASWHPVR